MTWRVWSRPTRIPELPTLRGAGSILLTWSNLTASLTGFSSRRHGARAESGISKIALVEGGERLILIRACTCHATEVSDPQEAPYGLYPCASQVF